MRHYVVCVDCHLSVETLLVHFSEHLASAEHSAKEDKHNAGDRFRSWATQFVEDAMDMNVNSAPQIRILFFSGVPHRIADRGSVDLQKTFKVSWMIRYWAYILYLQCLWEVHGV